jgi:hypothetical protein
MPLPRPLLPFCRLQAQRVPNCMDALCGLLVSESANCQHCGKTTHHSTYTQYFYNTSVSSGQTWSENLQMRLYA